MKKLFLFAIAALLVCGCTDSGIGETPDGGSDNTENPGGGNGSEDEKPDTPEYSINGSVQKGQFIQGSVVTIQELNERLQPTGKSYQTQILDDMGSFELASGIRSRYVEIIAEGFYFDEVAGNLSDAPLTLRALSDLALEGKSNVNLLTSLETPRIKHLVLNEGRTIPDARRTAEREVLRSFSIPQDELPSQEGFDKMDIARPGAGNAILLAISATLQHGRTVAQLSEIVSKIAADIEVNGQLKDEALLAAIRSNGMGIDADTIASNLKRRYAELSIVGYAIPQFDDYLDVDGNGVIDKLDSWFAAEQTPDFLIDGAAQTIEYKIASNVDYVIDIPQEAQKWIEFSDMTRIEMKPSTLMFQIAENTTGTIRESNIRICDDKGKIFQSISIKQLAHSGNIAFADNNIFRILIEHGVDRNEDGQISYLEVCTVESIGQWFSSMSFNGSETPFKSFDELQYFINIEQIEDYAFTGANNLTSIILPRSIKRIGLAAFSGVPIRTINLPDGLSIIGTAAFGGCSKLTDVELPKTLENIEDEAFSGCAMSSITIPESVKHIGNRAFFICPNLTAFYGKYASADNRSLIVANTLNSVISNLTEFNIPQGVRELESHVFESQHLLSSIHIPQSLVSIGNMAFFECNNLTSITIPENVVTIEYYAFQNCSHLNTIYCKAITPPVAVKFTEGDFSQYQFWNIFDGIAPEYKIYVPVASVDAYKNADGWSDYADRIVGYDFE